MKRIDNNHLKNTFHFLRRGFHDNYSKLNVLKLKKKHFYASSIILFFALGLLITYILNTQLSNENQDSRSRAASEGSVLKSRIPGSVTTAVVKSANEDDTVYVARDIYAINRNGSSGKTEVHQLSASSNFQEFKLQAATALGPTNSSQWSFALGFYDDDHVPDIYAINRNGSSGKTEVNILSGDSNFSQFILQAATALGSTVGDKWEFVGGNFDGDNKTDIYAINKQGASDKTEIHVLSGKSDFKQFSLQSASGLHSTDKNWSFYAAGSKGGGSIDVAHDSLFAINRRGASGKSEVHILNARSNFTEFNFQGVLPLEPTDNADWVFAGGAFDGNRDFFVDIYAINRNGGSGKTDVHVMADADKFEKFYMETPTGLHPVDDRWVFANAQNYSSTSAPDPTATVTPTIKPTSMPGVTVQPSVTKAPGVTNGPTSAPDPTEPVPTFVCGGSPDSICASPTVKPTKKPGDKPEPTSIVPTDTVGITPTITPPVNTNPDIDCLDPRSTPERIRDWVSGFLKKINDYIQRVVGNPQNPPAPPQPCVIQ